MFVFFTKRAEATKKAIDIESAKNAIEGLVAYKNGLEDYLSGKTFPHYVYWFLDTKRLDQLANDARQIVSGI